MFWLDKPKQDLYKLKQGLDKPKQIFVMRFLLG